jgi:hypothetical protein
MAIEETVLLGVTAKNNKKNRRSQKSGIFSTNLQQLSVPLFQSSLGIRQSSFPFRRKMNYEYICILVIQIFLTTKLTTCLVSSGRLRSSVSLITAVLHPTLFFSLRTRTHDVPNSSALVYALAY